MFKCVLTSNSITSNVITINLKTCLYWISFTLNKSRFAMISSPKPNIIYYYISAIHLNHDISWNFWRIWSTNSSKNIMNCSWVLRCSFICSISPFQKRFSILWSSLKKKTRNLNSVNIRNFNARFSIWRNQSSKTNSKNNSIWFCNFDWSLKIILTWLQ